MKNLIAFTAFTSTIIFLIPLGKFISKAVNHKDRKMLTKDYIADESDLSLRNFHPNKGE